MCGILGIAKRSGRIDPQLVVGMRDTMSHRGPDDAGIWQSADGRICLGHRRLAIIDLSPAGHQPMSDESGTAWLTFNGEIYNFHELRQSLESKSHRFRTATDSEVILAAYRQWGIACLEYLNGMFAFCLYDQNENVLFLARDRAGEKPLYYFHTEEQFVFASELKALLVDPAIPRSLNLDAFNQFFTHGYVPGSLSMLEGVKKLLPGHAITWELETGHLKTWPYWQLPEEAPVEESSPERLVDELESLLNDSVKMRMIADVPLGILLSGGLDSSLITAVAARTSSRRVKTFTITFPGHGSFDESEHARRVAAHFGTEHIELGAEPAATELMPELARQYDEPLADSSLIPTYMVSRLVREHATVALGGDGGDELFAGYTYYNRLANEERIRGLIPNVFLSGANRIAGKFLPVGFRGRNYLLGATADLATSIAYANVYFDHDARMKLLSRDVRARLDGTTWQPEAYKAALCRAGQSPLRQATAVDFLSYLVDDVLVKVDRASMLASLEVRAPWLDHRLIEFAFCRVPDALRASGTRRKILPALLAERLLPKDFDTARKQGFSLPLQSWFKGSWGPYLEEILSQADETLFDRKAIKTLIDSQRKGRSNTHRLFALAMFELWRREYRIAVPS